MLRQTCPNTLFGFQGCPPFTHLTLTGGAIGSGPPLAVGAAIACPSQVVINIQVGVDSVISAKYLANNREYHDGPVGSVSSCLGCNTGVSFTKDGICSQFCMEINAR